jgi:hypothetical protein
VGLGGTFGSKQWLRARNRPSVRLEAVHQVHFHGELLIASGPFLGQIVQRFNAKCERVVEEFRGVTNVENFVDSFIRL